MVYGLRDGWVAVRVHMGNGSRQDFGHAGDGATHSRGKTAYWYGGAHRRSWAHGHGMIWAGWAWEWERNGTRCMMIPMRYSSSAGLSVVSDSP